MAEEKLRSAALEYHESPTPGKISIAPTKALSNQRDLSLAYSPGVAYACTAIHDDPTLAARYTARANLVAVDGSYDDVNRLCAELGGKYPWAFVNINVRPYYSEGSKTVGYEIAEQLGWRLPDWQERLTGVLSREFFG